MDYATQANMNHYFSTYVYCIVWAELGAKTEEEKIHSLKLAQEAYKKYRELNPKESIHDINKKADAKKKDFIGLWT